jgi:hypothetical protein
MAIAIEDFNNEKTFESDERSKRFSLETKGKEDYETNHPDPQRRAEVPVR